MSHLDALRSYYAARAAHDAAKEATATAYSAFRSAEAALVEALMDADPPLLNLTETDKTHISIRQNMNLSVTQGNEQEVRTWLRETTGDDAPFSKESLDKAAVERHVKDGIAAGEIAEHEVPEILNLNRWSSISVRGWPAKKASL